MCAAYVPAAFQPKGGEDAYEWATRELEGTVDHFEDELVFGKEEGEGLGLDLAAGAGEWGFGEMFEVEACLVCRGDEDVAVDGVADLGWELEKGAVGLWDEGRGCGLELAGRRYSTLLAAASLRRARRWAFVIAVIDLDVVRGRRKIFEYLRNHKFDESRRKRRRSRTDGS